MRRHGFTLIELLVVIAIIALLAAMLFPVFTQACEKARETACLSNMKQIGAGLFSYLGDWDDTYPMNRFATLTKLHLNGPPDQPDLTPTWYNWKRAIEPYVRSTAVYMCPSNDDAWDSNCAAGIPGDETNCQDPWKGRPDEWIPNGYGYNGAFFHENSPEEGVLEHPRVLSEIKDPAALIFLLEDRASYPDLGDWACTAVFQHIDKRSNWLFADTHARGLRILQTLAPVYLWRNAGDSRRDCMAADVARFMAH